MNTWRTLVHDGELLPLERLNGTHAELRAAGKVLTGALTWVCYLFGPEGLKAICRKGKWKEQEI